MDLEDIQSLDEFDSDSSEEEVVFLVRAPKRYIRDAHNPFEMYDASEFKRRYRFTKDVIKNGILPKIEAGLSNVNNRGLPIPAVMQLLVCLRFYATASFQVLLGDAMTISQSTVSRIVFRVSVLIAGLMNEVIKMPNSVEGRRENQRLFKDLGRGDRGIGLPNVDGAIDCTHVRLVHTRFQALNEIYRNRKGYFSLNVQAVVGPRMEFLDVIPEWPGSQHDSRIFQNSRIYMRYMEGELNGFLVGDAGYPSLPCLITPVDNPVTDEQISYNFIHVRTRNIVERTFGVWKRRFPCLSRGLTNKLLTCTTIVMACAVLHNYALIFNDVLPDDELDPDHCEPNEPIPVHPPHWQPGEGLAFRAALIERLFR